jgi:hypothetical protein
MDFQSRKKSGASEKLKDTNAIALLESKWIPPFPIIFHRRPFLAGDQYTKKLEPSCK